MSKKQLNQSQLKKMYRQLQNELIDEQQKRLMSEKLLFNSKYFFLEAINAIDDPVFVKDEQHHWVYLNDALCESMGYPREELIGKSDYDFFPREQADVFWEKDDLVLQTGEPNLNEEEITFHGQTRIIATKKARFIDSETGKKYIIGTIRDITKQRRTTEELARYRNNLENLVKGRTRELTRANKALQEEVTQRKRAEELLKLEKEKYYYYINNAPDAVYIIDSSGRLQEINQAACDVTGYSEKELLALSFLDLAAPEDKQISEKLFHQLLEGKNIQSELLFQKKSGEKYYSFVDAVKISVDRIIAFCKDTTDRRRAEEAVRESEERYRAVVQQSSDCIFLVDLETKEIEEFNPSLERLLGYTREEFQKLTIYDFINHSKKDIDEKIEFIKKYNGLILGERQYIRKDRSIVEVDVSVSLIVYGGKEVMCVVARDISEKKKAEAERKKLEERIQQSQKLESLGILAGGVAHDFNNLLMGVLGNASLALEKISPTSALRNIVENIETSARRLAELSQQLLAYSGKGKFIVRPVNLSDLVEDMTELIKVSIPKNTSLNLSTAAGLPLIEADATQIRQIVMNLIINAAEALENKVGTISVRTGMEYCDRKFLRETYFGDDLPPGEYLFIEVKDTGCGMLPETMDKIFDPYFSTKFTGRGLGLAAVMGIVRGHRGALWLRSKPGSGTTFRVLFPLQEKSEESSEAVSEKDKYCSGEGTVLVIDDEEIVRDMACLLLKEMGFEVLSAGDGNQAMDVFKKNSDKIRFVLLDLTMPEMGGEEVFKELRQIKEDIPVIFSSGYSRQEIETHYSGDKSVKFLQKPYRLSDLMEKCSELLSNG